MAMSQDRPNPPGFQERLASMRSPPDDDSCLFHAITLTAEDDGRVTFGMHTEWVGFEDSDRRVELRRSRLVYSDHVKNWERIGLPYLFVLHMADLPIFLLLGGNALVERSVAERAFPRLLQELPAYHQGQAGYVGPGSIEPTALRRAPTPKLRMAVLNRDGRRCRICGRRPDDNVDLVLHVHHIRPWEVGGITEIPNLITLCHTCHSGLDPHNDISLFGYLESSGALAELADFGKRVANYRRAGFFGQSADLKSRTG